MTQQDLAARLQVAPKTISRWENQKTDCPGYVEAALREILRSTVQEQGRAVRLYIRRSLCRDRRYEGRL